MLQMCEKLQTILKYKSYTFLIFFIAKLILIKSSQWKTSQGCNITFVCLFLEDVDRRRGLTIRVAKDFIIEHGVICHVVGSKWQEWIIVPKGKRKFCTGAAHMKRQDTLADAGWESRLQNGEDNALLFWDAGFCFKSLFCLSLMSVINRL